MIPFFFVKGGSGKNNAQLAETEINAGFNLNIIANELDVDVDKLLSWNPGINDELQKKEKVHCIFRPILCLIFY
jgi:membrane-bound lytic murein transglycosylase D